MQHKVWITCPKWPQCERKNGVPLKKYPRAEWARLIQTYNNNGEIVPLTFEIGSSVDTGKILMHNPQALMTVSKINNKVDKSVGTSISDIRGHAIKKHDISSDALPPVLRRKNMQHGFHFTGATQEKKREMWCTYTDHHLRKKKKCQETKSDSSGIDDDNDDNVLLDDGIRINNVHTVQKKLH